MVNLSRPLVKSSLVKVSSLFGEGKGQDNLLTFSLLKMKYLLNLSFSFSNIFTVNTTMFDLVSLSYYEE